MSRIRKYKMRAECQADVGRFILPLCLNSLSFTRPDTLMGDVDVTFTCTYSLSGLRDHLAQIEDGHVMLESLNYATEYTGERYFDRKS